MVVRKYEISADNSSVEQDIGKNTVSTETLRGCFVKILIGCLSQPKH